MAIYHFSAQVISRSSGRSATAAAAYRAGEKIMDERTGEIHDYTRKKGVDSSWISAPTSAPDWVKNREKLWNKVESIEQRKDSQLAREINVALPTELDHVQQLELVREFVEEQFVSEGMVADICCHDLDTHNPHAHIMLTMREIDEHGFNAKKNRDWNKKELLEKQREAWADYTNKALEIAGVSKTIDHRSYEVQSVNRIPQIHLGVAVNAMRKRGIDTFREEQYLEIEAANKKIKKYEQIALKIDRLESIYRNNSEIESGLPTQFQTIPPPQTEKALSPYHHIINHPETAQKPTSESNQTEEQIAISLPETVSNKQRKQIIETARRFLQFEKSNVWNKEQGSRHYNLMTNPQGLLVIEAKDGRGEILRYQDGEIVREGLTEKDVEQFQKVSASLDQREKQVADTAARFLHLMGRNVWNSDASSRHYNLMTNKKGLLTIEAKDGRGEILRRQNGKIVTQGLTNEDVERFKQFDAAEDRKLKKVKSKQRKLGRGFSR